MRKSVLTLFLTAGLAAAPSLAQAQTRAVEQSRVIDASVGAVAGALIAGPIGIIAGGAIGYMMGPRMTSTAFGATRVATTRAARRHRAHVRHVQTAQQPARYRGYPAQPYGQQYLAPPMQAYPTQPGYVAQGYPQQPGYAPQPYPQQAVSGQPAYPTQRPYYNPARNPLVPSPMQVAPNSQPYAAVAAARPTPMGYAPAPGQPYGAPQAAPYPRIQAPPVPMPR